MDVADKEAELYSSQERLCSRWDVAWTVFLFAVLGHGYCRGLDVS